MIVQGNAVHAIALLEHLREREAADCRRLNLIPREQLLLELKQSFVSWAAIHEGRVLAMWGAKVGNLFATEAYIWLICAEGAERFPLTFARQSRRVVDELSQDFQRLYGYVFADYEKSVRWMQWLGFRLTRQGDLYLAEKVRGT